MPPLTRLLDEHATHPRAAITYGTNLVAILVLETLMWRHAMRNLANETVTDAVAMWRVARNRFAVGIGIVLAGMLVALAELALGLESGVAPYIYLLLIAAGIVRRAKQ